ncbi:MAG: Sec-independent protein translocase protein TatB [Alphaproteobacteria bacterium]
MADLSWTHLLILMVVALVVIGPKDLPKVMRTLGRWMAKIRATAEQFRRSFDDMARESELQELREEVERLKRERPLAGMGERILDPGPLDEPHEAPIVKREEAPERDKT